MAGYISTLLPDFARASEEERDDNKPSHGRPEIKPQRTSQPAQVSVVSNTALPSNGRRAQLLRGLDGNLDSSTNCQPNSPTNLANAIDRRTAQRLVFFRQALGYEE
jgi:hypothetical protein